MNILPVVKSIVGLATSLGAGAVVGNAIKATTPANLNRVQKVFVGIGAVTLSTVAGEIASNYIEAQIQEVVDGFRAGKTIKVDVVVEEVPTEGETPEDVESDESN